MGRRKRVRVEVVLDAERIAKPVELQSDALDSDDTAARSARGSSSRPEASTAAVDSRQRNSSTPTRPARKPSKGVRRRSLSIPLKSDGSLDLEKMGKISQKKFWATVEINREALRALVEESLRKRQRVNGYARPDERMEVG